MAFGKDLSGAVFEFYTPRYQSGELRVVSFRGKEQVSRLYSFDVVLAGSGVDVATIESDLLGERAHLRIAHGSDAARSVHGIIRKIEVEGLSGGGDAQHRFRVRIAPRLHLLKHSKTSRVFQQLTVQQVVDQILGQWRVERHWNLLGKLGQREYCVQYRESDLRYVKRLLAEEGIFFWFEHPHEDDGQEVVVFADSAELCGPIAGDPELAFRDSSGMVEREADVRRFRVADAVRPGSILHTEFDFKRPLLDLRASASTPKGTLPSGVGGLAALASEARGATPGLPDLPTIGDRAAMGGRATDLAASAAARAPGVDQPPSMPGGHDLASTPLGPAALGQGGVPGLDALAGLEAVRAQLTGGSGGGLLSLRQPLMGLMPDGASDEARMRIYEHEGQLEDAGIDDRAARRELEQHRAQARVSAGESRCRRLLPGHWLQLRGTAIQVHEGRYTLLRVEHEGHHPEGTADATGVEHDVYANRFWCVPADVPCRPRRPRRALQQVLETATVVGPSAHDIHTDVHGRVKVQFHWDLEGRYNENSSCWVRPMQSWAGAGWGFQFLPRVGMEVLVMFIGGDVDRPMVVGSSYNAANTPPFPLPREKTKSGIRSQSTVGGHGYNELSFEDRKDREQIFVRAQRDLEEAVGHDHNTTVRHNQTIRVGGNQTSQVEGAQFGVVGGNRVDMVSGDCVASITGDNRTSVERSDTRRVRRDATAEVGSDDMTSVGGNQIISVAGEQHTVIRGAVDTLIGDEESSGGARTAVWGDYRTSSSADIVLDGATSVTLKCGNSSIVLKEDEIVLASPKLRLWASEEVAVEGAGATLGLDGDAALMGEVTELHSSGAAVELDSNATLVGGKVRLRSGSGEQAAATSQEEVDERMRTVELTLLDGAGAPHANCRYQLLVAGLRLKGSTDGGGGLRQQVPADARAGRLLFWAEDGSREEVHLDIDQLPPTDTPRGALMRLRNIGFYTGDVGDGDDLDEPGRNALLAFQHDQGLDPTGELDGPTRSKLDEVGSR